MSSDPDYEYNSNVSDSNDDETADPFSDELPNEVLVFFTENTEKNNKIHS